MSQGTKIIDTELVDMFRMVRRYADEIVDSAENCEGHVPVADLTQFVTECKRVLDAIPVKWVVAIRPE